MKKNKLILIIAAVLVLVALALIFTNTTSTLRGDHSEFSLDDTSNVVRIYMADNEGKSVSIEKTSPGEWSLNTEFEASEPMVASLLKTMSDLEIMRPVSKKEHNAVVKRMAANSKKVEIYQIVPRINVFGWFSLFPHEKLNKTFYVGGSTKDNLGTYMLMENSNRPYVCFVPSLRGYVSPKFSTIEDDWRDHQVFEHRMQDIKSIDMDFVQDPVQSYRVENLDNLNLNLISKSNGQILSRYDTLRLLSFITSFEDIRYEAILSNALDPAYIDSVVHTEPKYVIRIVDVDNDTTLVTLYSKKGFKYIYDEYTDGPIMESVDIDRLYATLNGGRDFVLAQYFVLDKILKPLSYYIER
jgi:Domain of unknown function (DUF4340)